MTEVKLNKEQLEAVRHTKGALLIVAGAGTGKTTVITEKIKYLVSQGLAKTSEILALTFTEKAAREMEERVDVAMPLGYTQMWISTFHSFCDRVLRQEGFAIGIDTSYRLMTQSIATKLIKDHLYEFELDYFRPLGNPNKFINGLLQHFSRLQDEDVTPFDYVNWVNVKYKSPVDSESEEEELNKKKYLELSNAYKFYTELKIKEGMMDFGDLIIKTLELFRKRPNVLSEYQNKFKYVLVDEFQDTNIAQNELVKLLSADDGNITVVLDDDQSIYRFRGAAVSNALQFRNNFPEAKIVTLTKNYRTKQTILDSAYSLINYNNPDRLEIIEGIDKKLVSQIGAGGDTIFIHTKTQDDEAEKVSDEIKSLVGDNFNYKDIAVLVRANSHAEPFMRVFKRRGIPHQFIGPSKLFEQVEIKELICLLLVLNDVEDSVSLYSLLAGDFLDISGKDLVKISNAAKKQNTSIYTICQNVIEVDVSEDTKEKVSFFIDSIEKYFSLIKEKSAGELLFSFIEEFHLLEKYLNPDDADSQEKAENVATFFEKLKEFESSSQDSGVKSVVGWIELMQESGDTPLVSSSDWEKDAVNILTIHSSKGLEFPIVFVINLVTNRFPSINRSEQIPIPEGLIKEVLPEGDAHIQEERRLCYVALTRAQEKIYLTASESYGTYKRNSKLSPFIFEALGESVAGSEVDKPKQLPLISYSDDKKVINSELRDFHVDYLSYSQINTFEVCPLHYKLKYILKVPTPPTAPLTFGNVIHKTMNDFYIRAKKGVTPSKKLILDLYNKNWINEGYEHKNQEKDYRVRGESYLVDYLKISFNKANLPVALEKPFLVTLKEKRKGIRLKIGGKIDRIDSIPAQAGKQGIEIIDYKTGENVPTQKEVDKNEQLTFYALAVNKIKDDIQVDFDEVVLSLYYFESQEKISTKRTRDQLVEFENKLFQIKSDIENSDFVCSGGYLCKNCDFKNLCQVNF